jgi:hypothetical protein
VKPTFSNTFLPSRSSSQVVGNTFRSAKISALGSTRLRSCEIVATIGAGGRGEVDRARDTKLGARGREKRSLGWKRAGRAQASFLY